VEGSTVIYSCQAQSNLQVTYTWFKDGLQVGNGSQYSIKNVSRMLKFKYSCEASNGQENKFAEAPVAKVLCE